MKIILDRSIDAVYISLTTIKDKQIFKTYPCDPIEVKGQINLDFDDSGRLVGIEVLDASRMLPIELLREAEISD